MQKRRKFRRNAARGATGRKDARASFGAASA
jgi:hypothetical protein